ncbi:ABC transporter ATP-binding protein [Petroclostridium sp. X23]|uniref:ABC transporter ATP-binding protein n=1 Tax=Petroclostridium sp. X23 TaxID=3045146 RepID=UPI0024AE1373|nr:ABC transporter ATP-binding protein [Petroclostridium sp. X23]WHH57886.1 ABC transporter ATP-binding protein [Petroclostridium sp. X23]
MIRLFRFLIPYTLAVAGVLVLTLIQTLSQLYLPTLMSDIVDKGIISGDINYIYRIGGGMVLVAAIGAVSTIWTSDLSSKTAAGFGKNLRSMLFSHVQNFSLREVDKIGTASLITRTTNDITQVQQVTMMILRMMISAPMMCIGGIIMAVSKDPSLSLVIMAAIPILIAAIVIIATKGLPLFKAMQLKLDKLNLVVREYLIGIRVIRAFDRIDYEKRRFGGANKDLADTAITVNKIMAALMPIMTLILNFTTVAIIWFGGIRIDNGSMQVGDLMAFIQYVMQIMFSLIMVSMMFVMFPRASVSAARINEVLDLVPEINDPVQVKNTGNKRGLVEFKNVSFSYPGAEQPAVDNISFHAVPGEVTAIVGSTGSGKTTLISLIPRFYDVESGSVSIDGVDVRDIPQKDLRAKMGFVPQNVLLFTGTIEDNIRFGKKDALDDEVKHAAEIAQATEFISSMQDGFATQVAQGGTNVSGGQKQRISIARALIRRPEIYIFDDSFSALDFKTDAKLRAALKQETSHATVLIVAQRVSTVLGADRIVVLENGHVVGMDKHKELLKTCEVYREIVSSQLSEEEIA